MDEHDQEPLAEDPLIEASPSASNRSLVLAVGGFFLLGLALALLLFGGSLFNKSNDENQVDLPQIPTSAAGTSLSNTTPLTVGDRAHDFLLPDLDGNSVALSDFEGRPVIVNFWATWCAPCRLEMPELQNAYEAHQEAGLALLAVNAQEQEQQVREFFDELGFSFTPLLDEDGQVGRAYGALGLPSTYFINAAGEVTAVHRGILTEGQIDDYLAITLPR